jgi:type II secretory pathway pseudopilin PulG
MKLKIERFRQKVSMRGQTLVEVLLALAVVTVIITGIVAVVSNTLNNAQFGKNQNLANHYAQQGMEIVRAIRDRSWATFDLYQSGGSKSYFLAENITDLGPPNSDSNDNCPPPGPACTPNVAGIFSRRIKIRRNDPDCTPGAHITKVTVSVGWGDSKCHSSKPFCHKAELISCFSERPIIVQP